LEGQAGNHGVIKGFIYGNSLRFKLIFNNAPQFAEFQTLAKMINQTCEENKKNKTMLWYSQIHDKLQCHELFMLLPTTGDSYYFSVYTMPRNIIKGELDLKGLSNKLYSVEMLDDCIDILESAYTPFLDTPGAFINEKDWINKSFQLTNKARCEVFFYGDKAVGLYSHNDGSIEYVAVKKEYQNRGLGSVILSKAFQSILNDSTNSPSLCSGDKNIRAQKFYERVGMEKICSSVSVEISPENHST
jgi:ribosomal protein S18 acetylase RimI-like enzyme